MIEIDKFAKQGVLRIIVGNKKDLESKRQVSTKDAESLADKYGIKFMEVSAKDNTNIEALFLDIVKRLLENYLKSKGDIINTPSTNNVVLKKDKNLNKKKKCC
jgi:GTPase SAR1 family protein